MERIQIIADFDWLKQPEIVGELGHERLRGSSTYSFSFAQTWLNQHKTFMLSGDWNNYSGTQYKTNNIFSCVADAMPDRWGRRLIDKRERLIADKERCLPRTLTDFDYLLLLSDTARTGAFRFQKDGVFIGQDNEMPIPPLTDLREFVAMAHKYEQSDGVNGTIKEEWLNNLFRQGSSLGGARPKACVRDENGNLFIAKIPSNFDDYDVALWEHFAHCMAKKIGINAAETRLLELDGVKYHTLLSKRFDRNREKRIHFASAMTLCNLHDGADANTGNGYLDIVETIIGSAGIQNPSENLKELYRRVAFNICIGNHDDHFRNHGFILTQNGWNFSPAYDLNPTNETTQSILISRQTNESSLQELLAAHNDYFLTEKEAKKIIDFVRQGMRQWQTVANQCRISKSEQERFAKRFEVNLM